MTGVTRPPVPIPDDLPATEPWPAEEPELELPFDLDVPDDPFGDWLPDLPEPQEAPLDLDPPDDENPDFWLPELDIAEPPLDFDAAEPVILDWSTTAHLPAFMADIPTILDPTLARSIWVIPPGTRPPNSSPTLMVELVIGLFRTTVEVQLEEGEEPGLRLGRDALAGKALVRP